MIKCNGREALSMLAEVEAELLELTPSETKYAQKQVDSFVDWLADTNDISHDEALEIKDKIFAAEVRLLTAEDPFAEFIWSRPGDEVGMAEINNAEMQLSFQQVSDMEYADYTAYWDDARLNRHVGKYPTEVWSKSQETLDAVMELIKPYQLRLTHNLTLKIKDMNFLRACNQRLNYRRFGREPLLLHPHWAKAKNALNELLGNPKRYEIKEFKEQSVEEKIDILDAERAPSKNDALFYAAYGLDLAYHADQQDADTTLVDGE